MEKTKQITLPPLRKEKNGKGEMKFNVDAIIEACLNFVNEKKMIEYICLLFKEKQEEIFTHIFKECGKDFLIKKVEQALIIDNDGGMMKKGVSNDNNTNQTDNNDENNNNDKRSLGGIFFQLIKTSNEITKQSLKKIFWRNNKKRHEKRKFNKKFEKMVIKD